MKYKCINSTCKEYNKEVSINRESIRIIDNRVVTCHQCTSCGQLLDYIQAPNDMPHKGIKFGFKI